MNNNHDFTEANRKAWNEAMPYHRKKMNERWDKLFADRDYIIQTEPELGKLKEIGIQKRSIAHLCCNNGLELMSLKRMGAGRCVGFDISDEAISDATSRSARFGIGAEFHRYSVYDIPQSYDGAFDLVYITIGALTWLPDLKQFFAVVRRLLSPTGILFIYEQHPFMQVLPWDVSGENTVPSIQNDYFYDTYQVYNDGLDYYGNEQYQASDTYEFIHTLADILNAIIGSGLRINSFHEYEHDISNGLAWVQKTGLRLPLCYILVASAE